jgi:hypothetical protein
MAQTFNLSFLIENAPSEEYRQELMKLLKPSKTEYMKTKFQTLISFVTFIETEYATKYVDLWNNMKCKIFGSFVRQYCEMIYSTPADQAYGNIYDHDVDIRLFDDMNSHSDKKFITDLIHLFKTMIISKSEEFNFNGYKLLYLEEKTVTTLNKHDAEGKKLLHNIPHYFVVLEKGDDQIHIDLLAHNPVNNSSSLWNNDYDVNGLYMCRNGIFTNESRNGNGNFFKIQNSIMNRSAYVEYPIEQYVASLKRTPLNRALKRSAKVQIYNQLIHFIAFRTKIEEGGYTQASKGEMLSLSVEEDEQCEISDFEAPYIKVEFECSHFLSIMAFAKIVNIRASVDTEAILCPYCRANLIPKLVDSPSFKMITIPEIPNVEGLNKERVKTLKSSKSRQMMSEENMSCISGLFQGLTIPEVRERHDRRELLRERYELLSPGVRPGFGPGFGPVFGSGFGPVFGSGFASNSVTPQAPVRPVAPVTPVTPVTPVPPITILRREATPAITPYQSYAGVLQRRVQREAVQAVQSIPGNQQWEQYSSSEE